MTSTCLAATKPLLPEAVITSRDISILYLEVNVEDCDTWLRLLVSGAVKYAHASPYTFQDSDAVSMTPLELLPTLPEGNWTLAEIYKDGSGRMQVEPSSEPLVGVTEVWHERKVDAASLPIINELKPGTFETIIDGKPAIAKIAQFPWQTPWVVEETRVYAHIAREELKFPTSFPVAPKFLAHLTENGSRVMGLLVEKLHGRHARAADHRACEKALEKLHLMGVVHGDTNRYNFIVDEENQEEEEGLPIVKVIDFQHSEPWTEEAEKAELADLKRQLEETTGRGGTIVDGVVVD